MIIIPSNRIHDLITQLIFGKGSAQLSAKMDEPSQWLGKKHRTERHNPLKADFWETILAQTGIDSIKNLMNLLTKKGPAGFFEFVGKALLNNTRNALTHTIVDEISTAFKNFFNFERDQSALKKLEKMLKEMRKNTTTK